MSRFEFASITRRWLALVIDGLILFVPMAIVTNIIPFIGNLVVWFFYYPILESSKIQGSLGKYLMGIQVVDINGERISLKSALVRNSLKFVSNIVFFIGFIFALFTEKKQTIHDLLADTYVIRGESFFPVGQSWAEAIKDLFRKASVGSTFNESKEDSLKSLERLQSLRERGAITEEEFLAEKRKIIGG